MTPIRRLDHVAIVVADTDTALMHFRDRLGLAVVHGEVLEQPHVRLTYLDVGNAFIQLVEPLDDESELARTLAANGEGLHHICFGVDDALEAAATLTADGAVPVRGAGRGRISSFVPGPPVHGVRIECTEFDRTADVDSSRGWLGNSSESRA